MAISLRASSSWNYVSSGNITANTPGHSIGDMLIGRVAYKSSAIATCSASTSSTGWSKISTEFHDGTTNSGNGTGSMAVAAFWKIATATDSSDAPVITFSQTVTQVGAVVVAYQKGAGETWDTPVGDGGGDTSQGTDFSATIGSNVAVTAGDMVDFFVGIRDDGSFSARATLAQTGVTFGTLDSKPTTAGSDTTGADGSYDGGLRLATAGTSSAAATVTATLGTAETGAAWQTRIRVTASGTNANAGVAEGSGTADF